MSRVCLLFLAVCLRCVNLLSCVNRTCHKPTSKPWACVAQACIVSNSSRPVDNTSIFKTQQECAAKCVAPPPPPLSAAPCIRFGHTIPVSNHVDVTITNEADTAQTFTWHDYQFGQFSDWVNV